jgi:hypothetical protein
MRKRRFPAGETLFLEGSPSDDAYILRSGRVEILKNAPHGPIRLAVLGDGDVVGEMGLLDDQPRSATARTLEPVVADAIDRREFVSLLADDPTRALEILRALFERLRGMNQMLSAYVTTHGSAAPIPKLRLLPLTPEAQSALPADGVAVTRFPFRVGRQPAGRADETLGFNEVKLRDTKPSIVSLNHFSLDLAPDGVIVRDRGSQHGTVVNGDRIGALSRRDFASLHPGENEVAVGHTHFGRPSPAYRFKVILE